MRHWLLCGLVMLLSACALQEGPPATPPPPLTIAPPPTLSFAGSCNDSSTLSDWLHVSTFYVSEFSDLISNTAVKAPDEMYADVITMGQMRDIISQTVTPDCAEPAHRLMVRTMDEAIEGFQKLINGEADSLNDIVTVSLGQLGQVEVSHNELLAQLEAQLQE